MYSLSNFRERLSELIFDAGLTPTTLGESIGSSRMTINRYLSGSRYPSIEFLITLADFFNCTSDYLLGLEDTNHPETFYTPQPFNERFIWLCEHFGVTRYQVQKQTKISTSCIYSWHHSPKFPSLDNVLALAKFFDCTVDFVIGRTRN